MHLRAMYEGLQRNNLREIKGMDWLFGRIDQEDICSKRVLQTSLKAKQIHSYMLRHQRKWSYGEIITSQNEKLFKEKKMPYYLDMQ